MDVPVRRSVRSCVHRKKGSLPGGFSWPFILGVDAALLIVLLIAGAQRPSSQWWIGAVALAIACVPWFIFAFSDIMVSEAWALWLAWTVAVCVLLFATSTPIEGDFAPILLSLLTGAVGSVTTLRGGVLAMASAAGVLLGAAASGRVTTPALYLMLVGIGWLVGYLMRVQQRLLIKQKEADRKLAEHAAGDERRRLAREIHDVIAHSLSVTLLHVTGARRELQQERDVDEAVEALGQAERIGRQTMSDIRHTVGLLDEVDVRTTPEPGVDDIASLAHEFARAGLPVTYHAAGKFDGVSAATGLALYRIAQESLANVAKHAPHMPAQVTLSASGTEVSLVVTNRRATIQTSTPSTQGRGLHGMRQRVELLGGTIEAGPDRLEWRVAVTLPTSDVDFAAPRERRRC